MGFNRTARLQMKAHTPAAGEAEPTVSSLATVRCRACRKVVDISFAVDVTRELARRRGQDAGSAWVCKLCWSRLRPAN